ncbi:hypothetical protein QTI66_17450 [Variovorax sp. J22R133]|uniref:hypothetical protein n=1 Tax=Variovorax brevis TaxID=3053503 RepID=UPI0025757AFA|nr:hypothetical protein [Variovorax sp. J22R133]MDM0113944.1 hypothetical protein [Variovorax sp. J22R133]
MDAGPVVLDVSLELQNSSSIALDRAMRDAAHPVRFVCFQPLFGNCLLQAAPFSLSQERKAGGVDIIEEFGMLYLL